MLRAISINKQNYAPGAEGIKNATKYLPRAMINAINKNTKKKHAKHFEKQMMLAGLNDLDKVFEKSLKLLLSITCYRTHEGVEQKDSTRKTEKLLDNITQYLNNRKGKQSCALNQGVELHGLLRRKTIRRKI